MSSRRVLVADVITSSCVDGPGNRVVVFVQGCNFDCLTCHNPHTIDRLPGDGSQWVEIDDLVGAIRDAEPFVSGVTVSGGEATVQWRAVADLFAALAADPELAHLTRFVDSNGDAGPEIWNALATHMDGAMIDLKAFDPDVHAFLTGRTNERVLATIRQLADLGKLYEVRLLVVPGVNDRPDHLARTADHLTGIDPDIRVRVMAFRHAGTREVAEPFTEPTADHLHRAVGVLVDHGVRPDRISV